MANKWSIRVVLGILALMLLVPLAMPDLALARPVKKINSVEPTCEKTQNRLDELEKKEKNGTITSKEQGELTSLRELRDHLLCGFKDVKDVLELRGDAGEESSGGVDSTVGSDSKNDDCTWKNLWCTLAPVFEAAQTAVSPVFEAVQTAVIPGPGPTNPLPEPLPPLDPRPEPPDPLPPAPVPLSELSEESSGDPDSSESSDVDALAKDDGTPPPKTDMDRLKEEGYTCGRMGIGGYRCEKDGKVIYCDNAKRCARTVNPNPFGGLPKAPTNAGVAQEQTQPLKPQSLEPAPQQHNEENVASPSEVQGEVSTDQSSSGEGTEILVDPGVEMSEGSTTEAIR